MSNILVPKEMLANIPSLYETEGAKEPICYIKLFTPDSSWSWYVIEVSKDNLDVCYGYVCGLENELGYFSLQELATLTGLIGLSVELDINFKPMLLAEVRKKTKKASFGG